MGIGRSVGGRIAQQVARRGPAGIQGPTGAGALGYDLWGSQANPASVTDWGPLINTAAATHPKINLSAHDFPCTTALNFFGISSVVFVGESGFKWIDNHAPPAGQASRLIWKGGAASGPFVKLAGADSIQFRDLAIIYDNAAYNGDLIACDSPGAFISASCHFENCYLGSATVASFPLQTARCILRMPESVGFTFFKCSIGGALQGVRGREATNDISNDNVFENINTGHIANGHFVNIGENWHLDNVVFEMDFCGATSAGIDSDITTTSRFWMKDPTWWDSTADTQIAINQKPANTFDMTVHGGSVVGLGGTNFKLLGPGSVRVEDVAFTRGANPGTPAHIDVGTAGAGGGKSLIRITGCNHASANDTGLLAITNLDGGHTTIDVDGPWRSVQTLYGVRRLMYSGATADYKPTVAIIAGQPAGLAVVLSRGNCAAGYFYIENFDAAPSVAGNFAEITLPPIFVVPSTQPGFTHCPIVLLTNSGGFDECGLATAGGPTALNAARAANVGVVSIAANKFRLNSANAIPSGAKFILTYEIFLP